MGAPEGRRPPWAATVAKYRQPNDGKAARQLVDTLVPYLAVWVAAYLVLQAGQSPWLLLPLWLVGGGLLVRIFIFFHDCTHQLFFRSRRDNRVLGYIAGILTFTPFDAWQHAHAVQHATAGNLDRRGTGDVWTLTKAEYLAASPLRRLWYRFFRFPLATFGLGPFDARISAGSAAHTVG
ncbi:MAG: hypothetical protein GX605_11145 [Chloroflexi bacterium]|nr:hypothetical protein [Chloroflexota bacterium]